MKIPVRRPSLPVNFHQLDNNSLTSLIDFCDTIHYTRVQNQKKMKTPEEKSAILYLKTENKKQMYELFS